MGAVGSFHSKASSSRGRPYALMLLIAFGAALLGVMLLHKFRERRICNLLLKRTDQDLHSFQLLFQSEKDRSKELEKSNEDMTASLYLLRTQKMELDRKLLELQSTIDSLRDEQKILNVALQEKQSEIKALREKEIESGNENPQVVALTQSLKQKEDELEDLRRRLESRGAVTADDPSDADPRGDSTMSEEPKEQLLESSMDNNRGESKSTGLREGRTSRTNEFGAQKLEETHERRETEGEEMQKQENLEDEGENVDGEETKNTKDHKEKEVEDSEAVENGRVDKIPRSGMKMKTETAGKYGNTRKIRGKRWRYIAKRRTVDNGWRLISKKRKQENSRNLDDVAVISTTHKKLIEGAAEKMEEHTKEAKENLMEKENKMLQQENLNSENGDTSTMENGNGDVGEGSIKQNPREEMEQNDSKSKEKQETEQRMTSNEDGKEEEENKDEPEESEY